MGLKIILIAFCENNLTHLTYAFCERLLNLFLKVQIRLSEIIFQFMVLTLI